VDQYQEKFLGVLDESSAKCTSNSIALSGGLDSSAIAYCVRDKKPDAYAVIAEGFVATDLAYCQMASSSLDLPLRIVRAGTDEIVSGIESTIKILGNFNDIEVRNSLVMYLAINALKEKGCTSVITGDGADELFAGYRFMLEKSGEELGKDLQRIASIMHFPSKRIGKSLGIAVETPFLDEKMIEFARNLPLEYKIGAHGGKKFGKMIIRRSLEGRIPNQIVWREKAPMQDGSGTAGLTGLFDALVSDEMFEEKRKEVLDADGVNIRTKESLHYYQTFRRFHPTPNSQNTDNVCPDCRHVIEVNSKFCRMCGRFPI